MRVWNSVKELFLDADKIVKEMKTCRNIARLLRRVAAIAVIFVLFLQYWNILQYSSMEAPPRLDEAFRTFFRNNIGMLIICWIVYSYIVKEILFRLVIYIESKMKGNILPMWFTVDDCIDLCMSICFCFYSFNLLIEFANGVNIYEYDEKTYVIAGLYLLTIFVRWVYNHNCNIWYEIKRGYTQFYDSEGKRIPKDANVIYYGKRHKVYLGRKGNGKEQTKEWKISCDSNPFRDNLSLEEALRDINGHLVVEKW